MEKARISSLIVLPTCHATVVLKVAPSSGGAANTDGQRVSLPTVRQIAPSPCRHSVFLRLCNNANNYAVCIIAIRAVARNRNTNPNDKTNKGRICILVDGGGGAW